jgi:sugar phosphate isomerase/epimerase
MPVSPASPGRRALSLAHLSLIASPPEELIRIAGEAGFDLVDLRLSPATPTDRTYGDQERMALSRALLPVLRDAGLRVWDVEIIRINSQTHPEHHLPLMEAAALLGARRLKIVCDSFDPVLAADILARLCRLAAPFDLTLDLEYMVFSGVRSLPSALAIVEASGAPNLQVLVDALHWVRAGGTAAELRAAPRLGYVQLCDGPLLGPSGHDALIQEARTERLPPGEGEFPLDDLLDAMPPDCVASLEVPLPVGGEPHAHARRLLQSARALSDRHETAVIP